MINLEKLHVQFSPEDTVDDINFIVPLLKGLQNCQSLQELEIYCTPSGEMDYFDNLR